MRPLINHFKRLLKNNPVTYAVAVKMRNAFINPRAAVRGIFGKGKRILGRFPLFVKSAGFLRAKREQLRALNARPHPLRDPRTYFTIFYPEKAQALNLFPGYIKTAIKRKEYSQLVRGFYSLGDWSFHFGFLNQALVLWGYGADWLKASIEDIYPEEAHSDTMVFTSQYYTINIGHITILGDIVRLSLLGLVPKKKLRVYVHPDFMSNQVYYDKMSQYVETVPYPEDPALQERITTIQESLYFINTIKGRLWCNHFCALADVRWKESGRPPLLTLSEQEKDQGYATLAVLGLSRSKWFVTFHVRGPKYRNSPTDNTRNATLDHYGLAADSIWAAGGQVVLMGEAGVDVPEYLKGKVIDYANSSLRSPSMDVFLTAACRFFLGTSSGISHPSSSFGVPAIFANLSPPYSRPYYGSQMWVPKLLWSTRKKRYLTLAEMMKPPYCLMDRKYVQKRHGIEVYDNKAEDLQAVVLDMLDTLEGQFSNDKALQAYVESLDHSKPPVPYPSRLSPRFAQRHKDLLGLPIGVFNE